MKKATLIFLLFLYASATFSQTDSTIFNKLLKGKFSASISFGSSYCIDNEDFIPIAFRNTTYSPGYSGKAGLSYNVDCRKYGIGTNLSVSLQQLKINDSGIYSGLKFLLVDNYFYLSNPVYAKASLYHFVAIKAGISNNILLYSQYNNYISTYYGDKLSDYYINRKYYTDLYLALCIAKIKRFSFDIEYFRSLQPFRVADGLDIYRLPFDISYNKYQLLFTVNYELVKRKK